MHHIYHTTAFILGHVDTKEHDRFLTLFTRELGVVRATVQGIRKLSSRLRYTLQDFSYARVDLVQGKNIWRITSATKIEEPYVRTQNQLVVFARILEFIRRLFQGEEPVPVVFSILEQFLAFCGSCGEISEEDLFGLEYIVVLKVLSELGYIAPEGIVAPYLLADLSLEKAGEVYLDRKEILAVIHTALGETQL